MVALHTAIAIVLIVLLIIWVKVNPVISLIIGSLYLGLVTGVGFVATLALGFHQVDLVGDTRALDARKCLLSTV
ncbi:MAG: Gluconate transporter [Pseudonocardia sp.]|nr:Gluconate transporter [Pseudonocardia sp.]